MTSSIQYICSEMNGDFKNILSRQFNLFPKNK